jgi:O-antigen ligase
VSAASKLPSGLGFWAVSLFIFFLFSRVLDFQLSFLHLPLVLSLLALAVTLMVGMRAVVTSPVFRLFLLLSAWFVICVPTSVWPGGSYSVLKEEWFKSLMAGVIVIGLVQTVDAVAKLTQTMAYAFLIAGLLSFPYGELDLGRLQLMQGSYENPNDYATAMLYGCVCWWYLLHVPNQSPFLRTIAILSLPFQIYMLLKTGSRAALLATMITFIPVFWRYKVMVKILLVMALPLVAAAFLAVSTPEQRNRYLTIFASTQGSSEEEQATIGRATGSKEHRLEMAKDALLLTIQNPLFGVGPGMFAVAQHTHSQSQGQRKGSWLGTHNTYLQISSESGLPGFIIFLSILAWCWGRLSRVIRLYGPFTDTHGRKVHMLAYSLRLFILISTVFFFFEHIGYAPFLPVITGLISGFVLSAERDYAAGQKMVAESALLSRQIPLGRKNDAAGVFTPPRPYPAMR